MTMLEKMARAIFEAGIASFDDDALLKGLRYASRQEYIDAFWDTQIPKARAALEAMLEPSPAMICASWTVQTVGTLEDFGGDRDAAIADSVKRSWGAMIQAALDGK